jgi:hypothetical protein
MIPYTEVRFVQLDVAIDGSLSKRRVSVSVTSGTGAPTRAGGHRAPGRQRGRASSGVIDRWPLFLLIHRPPRVTQSEGPAAEHV